MNSPGRAGRVIEEWSTDAPWAGTPDEVAAMADLLVGERGGFITGGNFFMDGGVTASYWYGDLSPKNVPQK